MSTGGGRFTLPVGMQVESASYGYFDKGNQWVGQGNVSLGQTELFDTASDKNPSVFVEAGTTVLLKCKGTLSLIHILSICRNRWIHTLLP